MLKMTISLKKLISEKLSICNSKVDIFDFDSSKKLAKKSRKSKNKKN